MISIPISTTELSTITTKLAVDKRPENIKNIDISLDPTKVEEREQKKKQSIQNYEESFGSLDTDGSYVALFELLWYSQMPCFDVKGLTSTSKDELSFLKRCYWKQKRINCNAIFQQRPTDRGMCCAFNMQNAENTFKKSKYTDAISKRQEKDAIDAFEDPKPPNWYTAPNELHPEPGINKGLTLIVDSHSDKQSAATVNENFRGFITLVDGSEKFPIVSRTQLITRPGWENNIKVGAINLEAKNEIKEYKPEKRKCYFPHEYPLEIHQEYSQDNCLFECATDFATKCISTCSQSGKECDCKEVKFMKSGEMNRTECCVPWFYPINHKTSCKICDPWNQEKFLRILNEQLPEEQCSHCLADCKSTAYETTMTNAKLRECDRTNLGGPSFLCSLIEEPLSPAPWLNIAQKEFTNANLTVPWYLKTNHSKKDLGDLKFPNQRLRMVDKSKISTVIFPSDLLRNPTYDAFEKDIGILNVFFSEPKIMKYVKQNRMTNFGFFSQIGGSLGFVMGISVVSLIEVIYWFILRLFGRIVC